jgi:hypothetical protein
MSNKRKIFVKSDISIPVVEHQIIENKIVISPQACPPLITIVTFPPEVQRRTFDFMRWYGSGIDTITYACQIQINRFLANQDAEVTARTVITFCELGLKPFLNYLAILATEFGRELKLEDITRNTLDGYISMLDAEKVSKITKKNKYTATKSVLRELCNRRLINEIYGGDSATFPRNPFSGAARLAKGEKPLSKSQRRDVLVALRDAITPLFSENTEPTSYCLSCAILMIALYTGRNTTPILEMSPDCLHSHPKENHSFLALFKRRGYSISKVALSNPQGEQNGEKEMASLRASVTQIVKRVIELSNRLRHEAPVHFNNRVWLYRMRSSGRGTSEINKVHAISDATLANSIKELVEKYNIRDSDGKPLRLNISRLRKTFVNRVYEILDGDITATAAAAGNTVGVVSISYLRPGEDSQKNWKYMGIALSNELITNTLGATERTPVAQCSDNKNGEYAPAKSNKPCTNFLDCLRCRNFVVTGEDLYRLFSFYWRILGERSRMDPREWQKKMAHIVRLIDRDVIEVGLEKGIFKREFVNQERERAKNCPHPFWKDDSIIDDIREL